MRTQFSLLLHWQFPFKYEKALGRNPRLPGITSHFTDPSPVNYWPLLTVPTTYVPHSLYR